MNKRFLMSLIVILLIAISFVGGYFLGEKKSNKTEKTQEAKVEVKTPYTYMIGDVVSDKEDDGIDSIKTIYTFDNNGICVDGRFIWKFDNKEIANENYENWKEAKMENLTIIDELTVMFNEENLIGLTKDEVRSQLIVRDGCTFNEY